MARVPLQQALCTWEHGCVWTTELVVRDKLGRNSNGQFRFAPVQLSGTGTIGGWKTRSSQRLEESTEFWFYKGCPHVKWCGQPKRNFAGYVVRNITARNKRNEGTAAFDKAWSGDNLGNSQEVFVDKNYEYEREIDGRIRTYMPEDTGISEKRSYPGGQAQQRTRRTRDGELDTFEGRRLRDSYSGTGGTAEVDPVQNSWNRFSPNTSDLELDRGSSQGDFDEDVVVDRSAGTIPLQYGGHSRRHPSNGASANVRPYERDLASKGSFRGATSGSPSSNQSRTQLESRSNPLLRDELPWWRMDQAEAESYSSAVDFDDKRSAPGLGTQLDYKTGSSRETTAENWNEDPVDRQGTPLTDYVDRNDSRGQNRRKQEVSVLSDDEERVVRQTEKNRRNGFSRNQYRAEGGEVLERGLLYAKQVINQATARSLGVVTQLWVDLGSLKVVAMEVRANLLFGNFDSILLDSLSKVGDVILIHNESSFLDESDLFNCYDLVGSDIFTENGICLGKVRDYDFRLHDGAVLSLEFDSFGVPIIPSNVISTYSLTADEVIEAQEDGLLVRKGAEKRVRKLTKGLFSRPRQPPQARQYASQQSRRQLPAVTNASSSMSGAGALYRRQSDALEREDGDVAPKFPATDVLYRGTAPGREQRAFVDSAAPRPYEEKQGQDLGSRERLSASSKFESTPEESGEDNRTRPLDTKESLYPDASTTPQYENNRTSAPTAKFSGRGLPMSYRKSKRRIEPSGPL